MLFLLVLSCRWSDAFFRKEKEAARRDKGELVSRPRHDCGRKVMAVPFPFFVAKRVIHGVATKRFSWCLLRRFPSTRRPVFVLSLNEKTLRVRVSLSRESLRTVFVADYASVYAHMNFEFL